MSCRVCPLIWHSSINLDITSQTTNIRFLSIQGTVSDSARVLSSLPNSSTSYGYLCRSYGCGLTWRTEIKTEWFSGQKRQVLLIEGKRGKCHCDCGMKIFEVGCYDVFEVI
jgi:hypothetical protein